MSGTTAIRTTCAYCGVGCGVLAHVGNDGRVDISGDPAHPANYGRLCPKGAALGDTLDHAGRLLHPRIGARVVGWDAALNRVAARFNETIAQYGPDAVAFYVSGQLTIEDYYVANKLMKGYIGSANIDTNSRLCMASSVVAHKRAFGEDIVPGVYADLEQASLVVLVGSNLAWCHPVLAQRLAHARERHGTRVIVIDPRATATSIEADLHLPLAPGSDVALFNGLLRDLIDACACDEDYIAAHTHDFSAVAVSVASFDLATVARATGLAPALIAQFYRAFREHARTVTAWSQGANQSHAGSDKVNAIINCHLATGRIGRPGTGPLSLTGQPNAMGGREVGGMATTLAAHLDCDDADARAAVQAFWHSPRIAGRDGLKAVDLFQSVADGRIKALWIIATNPLLSLPDGAQVAAALAACPFVVVSDISADSVTVAAADVVLPAAGWGEKDGTVTNSERRVSRQRRFVDPPGAARPDWWAICEVAKRMGFGDAFDYGGPAAILREHAELTALAHARGRRLDLGALAELDDDGYAALAPRQWPPADNDDCNADGDVRLFGDGVFATQDGRARFVVTPWRAVHARPDMLHPYVLNTGRTRDQWHGMTRSGRAVRLNAHRAEPYVELHPLTAARYGLAAAELAAVERGTQRVVARVLITDAVQPDALFVPMHWSAAFASAGAVNALVPAVTDPLSGQPELKAATVALRRYAAVWYGFALTRDGSALPGCGYWARMRAGAGWRFELADSVALDDIDRLFAALGGGRAGDEVVRMDDCKAATHRLLAFRGGRLEVALFVGRAPVAVARDWLVRAFGDSSSASDRGQLLAGRPRVPGAAVGAPLCTCLQVGRPEVEVAVAAGHASLGAIAKATGAGSGCGGCRVEIARLLAAHAATAVA